MGRGRAAQHSSGAGPAEASGRRRRSRLLTLIATLVATLGCSAPRETTDLPDDPREALRELAWLPGDWRQLDVPTPRGERWWYDGQELVGEAWVTDRDRRLVTERLAIQVREEDDRLVYVADFPGREQEPIEFPLYELGRRAVAFENREHGHPWRLAYVQTSLGLEVAVFFRDEPGGPSRVERMRLVRVDG